VVAAFLLARSLEGRPHFEVLADAEAEYLIFVRNWRRERLNDRKTRRYLVATPSVSDISRALSELRKKLESAGMGHQIRHLAPERSRVGFEIRREASS
jgi:hypothetical protein